MFNPTQMLDPAVMAFFKQAGPEFGDCVKAEAEGKLDALLDKYCDGDRPDAVAHVQFQNKCMVYAAKAFAAAHIDGKVSWGAIKEMFAASSAWPPAASMNGRGALFLAYMIGFLHGSELPLDRQKKIEGMLPLAATVAASPEKFAQSLGVNPDKLKSMAEGMGARGLDAMANLFKKDTPS
jgi:hypothetical protein